MAEEIVIVIKTVLDRRQAAKVGQEAGQALTKAIETGRNRSAVERQEERHLRRLEALHLQTGNRLQVIEARRQASLDLIRERGLQKQLEHERKIQREAQRTENAFGRVRSAVGGIQTAFAALAAFGVVRIFEQIGTASVQAAIRIDQQRNALRALIGSAEAAQRRFAELVATSRATPGLTTDLALQLDLQSRILGVRQQTIDRILPAVGRLNAISPLGDPAGFVGNLAQLITQGFERQDLKELVGRSPFAGELIKQIFNVDSPTNAAAIRESARRLGITSVDALFTAMAAAAEDNAKLQSVGESLGSQFEKLRSRIDTALAPIGEQLAKTILPLLEDFADRVEKLAPVIERVFSQNRTALIESARATLDLVKATVELRGAYLNLIGLDPFDVTLKTVRGLAIAMRTLQDVAEITAATIKGAFSSAFAAVGIAIQKTLNLVGVSFARLDDFVANQQNILRESLGRADQGFINTRRVFSELRTGQIFDAAEANRQPGVLSGLLEGLKASADFAVESGLGRRRRGVGGDGAGTGSGAARVRVDRAAQELVEIRKKIAEGNAEFLEQAVKDLEEIHKSLIEINLQGEIERQRALGRPARLARHSVFLQERIEAIEAEDARLARNTAKEAAEALAKIPPVLSDSERFMRGFADATETAGDAFERFGASVARAFGNVRDLFNGLKQAVLGFFRDILGSTLQNLVRGALAPILGGLGGSLGNLFRTPSFAGGGGISAPPSISGGLAGSISSIAGAIPGFGGILGAAGGGARASTAGGGFSLGGFGGFGESLLSAAPLLGLTIGGALGGSSRAGNILGAAGGLLTSTFISTTLGAPGALGSLAPALFSNPITAIVGAGLLVGSIFLGKASQRKKDEQASGEFLTQALQGIQQLAAAVSSGQVPGSQARGIFDRDILGVFKQQISSLKTKSVRESRLTNQVRDLERNYQDVVGAAIAERTALDLRLSENASRFSRQIPEFAFGGTVPGIDRGRDSVLSLLRPGELVLTRGQQASVIAQSDPGVFDRAGVPRGAAFSGGAQAFQFGGTAQAVSQEPMVVEVDVNVVMGKDDQTQIFVTGGSTVRGRQVIVKQINSAKINRELT